MAVLRRLRPMPRLVVPLARLPWEVRVVLLLVNIRARDPWEVRVVPIVIIRARDQWAVRHQTHMAEKDPWDPRRQAASILVLLARLPWNMTAWRLPLRLGRDPLVELPLLPETVPITCRLPEEDPPKTSRLAKQVVTIHLRRVGVRPTRMRRRRLP